MDERLIRAVTYHQEGALEQAKSLYEQVLQDSPDHAQALNLLGVVALQEGDLERAIELLSQAVAANPTNTDAHFNLGLSYATAEQWPAAVASYQRCIELDPSTQSALINLGVAYDKLDKLTAAEDCYRQALLLDESLADLHYNLGLILKRQSRLDEAIACFKQAVDLASDHAPAYTDLGFALLEFSDRSAARHYYELAIAADPDYSPALNNLGELLIEAGETEAGVSCFEDAIDAYPDNGEAHLNLAYEYLKKGDFQSGWEEYRWRFAKKKPTQFNAYGLPVFAGKKEALRGKSIVIANEQGIGDEIIFASCIADCLLVCERVLLICTPRLETLFQRSFPGCEVLGLESTEFLPSAVSSGIDYCLPAGNLMALFRQSLAEFPAHSGYLEAKPALVQQWHEKLHALGPGLKVGIAWRSMLYSYKREQYYTRLEQWAELLSLPSIHFIGLQHGECEQEIADFETKFGLAPHQFSTLDLKNDFEGTAALLKNLDLVLCSQTSLFCLTGALGVKSWTLCAYHGFFEMFGTESVPLFPSIEVIKQTHPGEWESVFSEIHRRLAG